MIIDNKVENIFGRNALFAGVIFLFSGIGFVFLGAYITGVIVIIISVFVIFSYSGVMIDTDNRKIKKYDKLFGFFKTGKWIRLSHFRGLTSIPFIKTESIVSWSNRRTSNKETYFRIFLVNKALKPDMLIKRCDTKEGAQRSIDELSIWLHLPVYSVRR